MSLATALLLVFVAGATGFGLGVWLAAPDWIEDTIDRRLA